MIIPYAVGFDDTGAMCIEDIVEFPHLLLGGATRSGKSTAIMSLLMSIAFKHRTGDVNVLIMDLPGKEQSDFNVFNRQSLLSAPVITEPVVARNAILQLHEEKLRRLKASNLPDLPYIICVIDEFPRLYSGVSEKESENQIESIVNDLLSSGRHAKIHMVLAAQNPAREDMKGSIANITARIALKCAHYQNSITILGRAGAEKLLGRGQMIFDSASGKDKVLQGSYISPYDMKALLAEIEKNYEQQNRWPFKISDLDFSLDPTWSDSGIAASAKNLQMQSNDEKLIRAIRWSLPQKNIANSRLQNELHIGNTIANRLLSRMEELNLIHKLHGNLGWERVPKCFDDISPETVKYLTEHGIKEDEIKAAFSDGST